MKFSQEGTLGDQLVNVLLFLIAASTCSKKSSPFLQPIGSPTTISNGKPAEHLFSLSGAQIFHKALA
jgi:hypothetical protein